MFRIYLSGGMKNLSIEDQLSWRTNFIQNIQHYDERIDIFNPFDYYNYISPTHNTEKEVLRFETRNLKKSDLVVMYYNSPHSIGTAMELAIAYENNIPILTIQPERPNVLHPWIEEMSDRIFSDIKSCVEHIHEYYLV